MQEGIVVPLDLEWLLRTLEGEFGAELERGEAVDTVLAARRLLEAHEKSDQTTR